MKNLKNMMASMFAGAAAANPDFKFRNPREAYPDLQLPRPADVQARLVANANNKRVRKGLLRYNKTLDNGKVIVQTYNRNEHPLAALPKKSKLSRLLGR